MPIDTNPNARSAFVDSSGRLSKYGMDVITKVYNVLEISGDNSIINDSIANSAVLDNVARLSSMLQSIQKKFNALEASINDVQVVSKISSIEKRLNDLEAQL